MEKSVSAPTNRLIRAKELFNAPSQPVPLPVVPHLLKRQRHPAGLVPHVVPLYRAGFQQPAPYRADGRLCLVGIGKRRPPAGKVLRRLAVVLDLAPTSPDRPRLPERPRAGHGFEVVNVDTKVAPAFGNRDVYSSTVACNYAICNI